MEARNGKWVNVDYSQRVLDENYATGASSDQQRRSSSSASSLRQSRTGNTSSNGGYGYATTTAAQSAPGSSAASETDEYSIQITVSEPVKQGEGMNAYISYKISTTTNRPQFTKSAFSVIRRYSDFVWLHGNLSSMYPGVVVPPLPEKLLVGRFSSEFIESRRRALQVFLVRCSSHPELQHSEHLTTFLEASDDALAVFKADPKHANLKGTRGSLFQWLDDTVNTISSTLGASACVNLEKTSADIEVDEMMNYIDGLEPIMTGLHKHANGLTKRAREIADGLFEFGVAYSLLGKSEESASLQEALREIAHCADTLSLLAAEFAEKEALHFEEPILDYIRLVGAVKAALQKRNDVRSSYGMAVADLDAKSGVVEKLLKHKHASEEKFQVAESDVLRAQHRVDDAKLEFDIVTERVMREVERFKREKLADFKKIVLDYVQMQIAYSKKVEEEWSRVIPKLAQIRIDTGSPVAAAASSSSSIGSASLIQEDYIPSNGAASATARTGRMQASDLSSNLLSLSLDQEDDEGENLEEKSHGHYAAEDPYHRTNTASSNTRINRVQVQVRSQLASSSSSSYNPDLAL